MGTDKAARRVLLQLATVQKLLHWLLMKAAQRSALSMVWLHALPAAE